jgi:anaerobic dimethyl sulfoxide reductase subunit B (iron-sulfur subunit)
LVAQYAFVVNSDACSGCKTCQVACNDKHDIPVGIHWRKVYEVTAGSWQKREAAWISTVAAYNLSVTCNHCMNPVCLIPCSPHAIWQREDGIVLIDESLCNCCRACEHACPYDVIRFDAVTHTITKCHFCVDYIDMGLPPACVAACPNRALDYGDYGELKKKYGDVRGIFPLPDPSISQPALIIIPHRNAALAQDRNPEVSNWEEL